MKLNNIQTALLVALFTAGAATGCEAESEIDTYAEDNLEGDEEELDFDAPQGANADLEDGDEPDTRPGDEPDALAAELDPMAANWELELNYNSYLRWAVNYSLPESYTICWKLASASGRVCKANSASVTVQSTDSDGFAQRWIPGLQCGVNYKFRVKRSTFSYDTEILSFSC